MVPPGPRTVRDTHDEQTHNVTVLPRPVDDGGTVVPPRPEDDGRRKRRRYIIGGSVVAAAAIGAIIALALPGPTPPPAPQLLTYTQLRTGDCLTGSDSPSGSESAAIVRDNSDDETRRRA